MFSFSKFKLDEGEICLVDDNTHIYKWRIKKLPNSNPDPEERSIYLPSVCFSLLTVDNDLVDQIKRLKIACNDLIKQSKAILLFCNKDKILDKINKIKYSKVKEVRLSLFYFQMMFKMIFIFKLKKSKLKLNKIECDNDLASLLYEIKAEINELMFETNQLANEEEEYSTDDSLLIYANYDRNELAKSLNENIKVLIGDYEECTKIIASFDEQSTTKSKRDHIGS